MTTRRALLGRLGLLAVGGGALFALRDRLPGAGPSVRFDRPAGTPWLPLPPNGGLIEIDVTVGQAPLRALVDSGAEISAIDRGIAARLALTQRIAAPVLAYGVTGGPSLARTVNLAFGVPGLDVSGLAAAALDLDALAQAANRDFQMIIGRDVLRRLLLDADFRHVRVRLFPAGAARLPPNALVIPLQNAGGAPTARVRVEQARPLSILVDTGSSGVLALAEPAARAAGLLAPGRLIDTQPSLGLGGLSLDRRVNARSLTLGGITVADAPVQIYPARPGWPAPQGLLGTGLLRSYRTLLDLPSARLILVRSGLALVPPPR